MTITPVPVRPAAVSPTASRDGHASDPEGFAALVSRETERLTGGCCEGAPADGAVPGGPDGGTAEASVGDVPADAVLAGGVPSEPVVDVAPGVSPLGTSGAADASTGEQAARPTGATLDVPAAGTDARLVLANGALAEQAGAPGTGAPGTGDTTPVSGIGAAGTSAADGGTGSPTGAPGNDAPGATADAPSGAPGVAEPGAPAGAPGATTSTEGTASAGGTDVVGAPVAGSSTAAGAEAAGDAAPTGNTGRTTAALLDQVSPTLTRMVSRGDGEHRMTLKIHPADLGEVHLTVTVRGERVDVDIAASAEARELLRDGLTQLRTLLDPTGKGGGQLVFRDLPNAPAAGQQLVSAETGTGGDQGSRAGSSGADGSSSEHGGRRSHHGPHAARTAPGADTSPAAAPGRQPGSGTRTVDLTI